MVTEIIQIVTPAMVIMYGFYRYIDKKTNEKIDEFHKEKEKLEKQKEEIIKEKLNNIIIIEKENTDPIEKVKEHVKNNKDKYKPKKNKPHYWTEHIDTSKLNNSTNENSKSTENKNSKKNFYDLKQEWIKKGKEYEKKIGEYYERLGYIVKFNGIEKGKKDNSIDLIAIKQNEILFIQCKNWKENSKHKITHKDIKSFIGDTYTFIDKNSQYKNYIIKRYFVISNKILDKAAYAYIKENNDIIDYKLIKFDE